MQFFKYQGTGNDFIMIDNRKETFSKNNANWIAHLCNRKFGIGADGLILLENHQSLDFKMVYYNSDGNESSMCGNGGRCIVAFAKKLNVIKNSATFEAIDGLHVATIDSNEMVSLQMKDVEEVSVATDYVFLNTGSPHHVTFVDNLKEFDVKNQGAKIRYSSLYGNVGCNINFVKQLENDIFAVRTYERGVEDETLSCGTGATAVAIAMYKTNKTKSREIQLLVEGGKLKVTFEEHNNKFYKVFLTGPAQFVFSGTLETSKL